ncbi:TraR/DksA C4-type zinc finger protein [Candidatus Kaiserbacteria bacterium]|nr:MAG: TraR/DksA C4-type zinc finger protein [Candidatus Kaiserbacteria bacterium]
MEQKKANLFRRRESKVRILKRGGEQALSHSYYDVTRIDFALKRIEEGQYGLCTSCGVPIQEERLQIIPETPFCAHCAKLIEVQ